MNEHYDVLLSEPPAEVSSTGPDRINTYAQSDSMCYCVSETKVLDRESRVLINRIKVREVCLMTRQLSTLLRAGLPLVGALTALVEQFEDRPMSLVLGEVRDRVKDGISFSESLLGYPKLFSNLYLRMIEAGEASGALEQVLSRLADSMEKRMKLTATVRSALTYPVFMAVTAAAVVFFLTTFVVPSITNIFLEMDQALPWPTIALIQISTLMREFWLVILLVVFAMIFGFRWYIQSPRGKGMWDRYRLQLPLFGGLFNRIEQARFFRTMSLLMSSGISVLDGLMIVKGIIQNGYLAGKLDRVCDEIARGESPAVALKRMDWLSPVMIHAIAIGELSGSLEDQLREMTSMVEEDIERQAGWMTSLLEPAVLIVMGLVIGFIVLAILLPIFDIQQMI